MGADGSSLKNSRSPSLKPGGQYIQTSHSLWNNNGRNLANTWSVACASLSSGSQQEKSKGFDSVLSFLPSAEQEKQPHASFPTGKYNKWESTDIWEEKILSYLKSCKILFPWSPTAVPINSRYKNGKQAGRSCDYQRKASLSRGGHLSLWFPSQWFGKREGKAQNLWKSCLVSQDFGATAPRLTTAHDKVSKNKRINEVTKTTKIIQSNCHWVQHLSFPWNPPGKGRMSWKPRGAMALTKLQFGLTLAPRHQGLVKTWWTQSNG